MTVDTLVPVAHGAVPETLLSEQFESDGSAQPDEPIGALAAVEPADVDARIALWRSSFAIQNAFQDHQLRQLVTESIRIERCQSEEFSLIAESKLRARACWESDRLADTQLLVSKLARSPERWRNELVRSAQGCRWILNEWKNLRSALVATGWDTRQRSRVFDLLGISTLYRSGTTPIDLDDSDQLMHRVDQEIEHLEEVLSGSLEELDGFHQTQAEAGLRPHDDRKLQAVRRFEAGCQRRYDQYLKALQSKPAVVAAESSIAHRSQPPVDSPSETREARIARKIRMTMDFLQRNQPDVVQTEQLSAPSASSAVAVTPDRTATPAEAAGFSEKSRPTSPASSNGSRKQRRRAVALARRGK